MAGYATIWSNYLGISYGMAKSMAAARNGELYSDNKPGWLYESQIPQWAYDGLIPSDDYRYNPVWLGTERRADGWYWADGTKIAQSAFREGDVNGDDDLTNDTQLVISYAGTLLGSNPLYDPPFNTNTLEQSSTGYIMQYNTPVVVGTEGADWVVGVGLGVKSIKLLGGDDRMGDVGSAEFIDLGAGNDDVLVDNQSGTYVTVVDGDGEDMVTVAYGEIKASSDGDNDWYYAPKLDYATAKQGIFVSANIASSDEIGSDTLDVAKELYLGSGNDVVEVFYGGKLYLRGGDDSAYVGHSNGGSRWVDGGAGNDTLVAGYGGGNLIGGAGNDTLQLAGNWDTYFNVEMTGGAGSDTFKFATFQGPSSMKPIINDFAATGTVQDKMDLTAYDLDANSVQDAVAQGMLRISASKGYTTITVNDGLEGFSDFSLSLKGTFGTEIYDNIWI